MGDTQLKNVKTHKFYSLIVETLTKDFKTEPKPSHTLYLKKVHQKFINICNVLHTLQIARILIAEQHPSIEGNKSKVKIADFLRYNVENYYMRITAYHDVIMQLLNEVNCWEIPSQFNFNQRVKIRAKKEKNHDAQLIVKNLDEILKNVKLKRNKIAHEGSFATDIIFLEIADFLSENIPSSNIDETDRNIFYAKLIIDNTKEMLQIEQDLATNLLGVMDLLWPVYKKNFEAYTQG